MDAMISTGEMSEEERKAVFAKNLRKHMLLRGWSASDVGRAAGKMHRENISRYLRGVSLPNEKSLALLANAFGCEVEALVPGAGWPMPKPREKEDYRIVAGLVPGLVLLTVNKHVSPSIATRILEILAEEPRARVADGS